MNKDIEREKKKTEYITILVHEEEAFSSKNLRKGSLQNHYDIKEVKTEKFSSTALISILMPNLQI